MKFVFRDLALTIERAITENKDKVLMGDYNIDSLHKPEGLCLEKIPNACDMISVNNFQTTRYSKKTFALI